jgi:predicted choloylglycine hydrolase
MCTIVAGNKDQRLYIGRNFDWLQCGAQLQVFPSDRIYGYQTLKHITIEQQGEDMPYEGTNDSGVFIGMTAVEFEPAPRDTRIEFDALGVMKYILERAKSAIEAVRILNAVKLNYTNQDGFATGTSYLIADKELNVFLYQENLGSRTIKLNHGELCILRAGASIDECLLQKDELFGVQMNIFRDTSDMKLVCRSVATHDTAWSTVYNLQESELTLYIEQNFSLPFSFKLDDLYAKGRYSDNFGNMKIRKIKCKDDLKEYTYRIHSTETSGFPKLNEL